MATRIVSVCWRTHNFSDYIDANYRTKKAYSKSLEQIVTVRFSADDVTRLRKIAAQNGIGMATLIRLKIRDYLENEY